MDIGARNYSDQGFKSFEMHSSWGWQPIVFTELKSGFVG